MAIDMTALDAAINALVAKQQTSYAIGDKSFQNSDKLRQLLELRQNLATTPEVALEMISFDGDVALNGFDRTQTTTEL